MRRRVCRRDKWPTPVNAKLVVTVPIIIPDTVGTRLNNSRIFTLRRNAIQQLQVANEDAFELRPIRSTVRFARIMYHIVGIRQRRDGGLGNRCRRFQVRLVRRCSVQLGQTAEDDTLVVRPPA
jgi:hypothetical protein